MGMNHFTSSLRFAITLATLIGIMPLLGQTPRQFTPEAQTARRTPSFEVAMFRLEDPRTTVDYNRPDAPNQNPTFPTNQLTMFHTLLKSVIADAYGVGSQNILGGPDWLTSQHYDLSAKVEGDVRLTKEQMRPMLQSLLKERLHLVVHSEQRIVSGYALVIAKGGSKLKANTGAPFGGMNTVDEANLQNASLNTLVSIIRSVVKQPVVDKTGLSETYDFDLKFAPENAPSDSRHSAYGDIFGAIQEQLGLKLEPQKVPVDYLVIDSVERVPTEN